MKKVLAYDKSGISKELKTPRQAKPDIPLQEGNNSPSPKGCQPKADEVVYQGGGFFKNYELEQYEEALENCKLGNCKYEDGDLFNAPGKNPHQEYVFHKDEKMLKVLEIDDEKDKVKSEKNKYGISILLCYERRKASMNEEAVKK